MMKRTLVFMVAFGALVFALNLASGQSTPRIHLSRSSTLYEGDSANVSRLIDSLIHGYDKRLRPNYKGPPVEVGITMFISSVSSVSEVDMDFTLDFYFRQSWHDPRLKFEESDNEELCISNEMLNRIWWPDTFFANAKDAKFHQATTKNAFLRIKPTGHVLQSLRLTVTADCKMDLTYFPFDSQSCPLEIESYGFSMKDIKYKWLDGPNASVSIQQDVQLPQFNVRGHRASMRIQNLTTGAYSRLSCEIFFVRRLGYYMIQIYVPSCLIVVLSWVSFWLPREAVPARVALGITTVLTMTTLISSTNASLPKISYLKSIDVFLVICFIMVFGSIIEYAVVSFLNNRSKLSQKKQSAESAAKLEASKSNVNARKAGDRNQFSLEQQRDTTGMRLGALHNRKPQTERGVSTPVTAMLPPTPDHREPMIEKLKPLPNVNDRRAGVLRVLLHPGSIDKASRLFLPVIFITFNIGYWKYYLGKVGDFSEDMSGFVFMNVDE